MRNQLVPPKVALALQKLHLRGNAAMTDPSSPNCELLVGECRLPVTGSNAQDLARRLETVWEGPRAALDHDVGTATKYDPLTIRIATSERSVRIECAGLTPGTPDDLFLELAVASLTQSGHLLLRDLRAAAPVSHRRRVLDWPALRRQIVPMETVDLVEHVHTGHPGLDRNGIGVESGEGVDPQ